jgi:hypothetical protein
MASNIAKLPELLQCLSAPANSALSGFSRTSLASRLERFDSKAIN